jgi:hypothetical protein
MLEKTGWRLSEAQLEIWFAQKLSKEQTLQYG